VANKNSGALECMQQAIHSFIHSFIHSKATCICRAQSRPSA